MVNSGYFSRVRCTYVRSRRFLFVSMHIYAQQDLRLDTYGNNSIRITNISIQEQVTSTAVQTCSICSSSLIFKNL